MPLLHHERIGEGPAVVVLHGLFGSGRNWKSVARRLAREHAFYLVDLRNHGRSPHADSMSYPELAADVRELAEALRLGEFTLVGHSMGGKAAMTLALDDPAGIARLVVVDIAPAAYEDRLSAIIEAMMALDLGAVRRRADAERMLTASIPDPAVRLFVLQNLELASGSARWRINLPALLRELPRILGPVPAAGGARFTGETWFIRGERSDRVTDEHLATIRVLFPNHRIETVPGAGHWPHTEAPAAFLEIFSRALGD